MHATVKWAEGLQFIGESGSGHPVVLDSPDNNKGISPMEMLLLGVGGCSAFDVIMILEKTRQKMLDCRVEVDGERTEEPPRVFTKINMKFIVSGHALNEDQVNRAIELSATKYCGASIMMEAAGAEVKRSCEIIQL